MFYRKTGCSMKLRVLGNNGPYPAAGGACSSYLLEAGGRKMLIDMGSGCLAELQKHCPVSDIDVIILTHLHYDHIGDIQLLKYAFGANRKAFEGKRSIMLFLPFHPVDIFRSVCDDRFDVRIVTDGMKAEFFGIEARFMLVKHPVECYAVEITDGVSRFVFSADTYDAEPIKQAVNNADLFLVDACLVENDKKESSLHFSVKEACEVGKSAKRTLLTHFSPIYARDELEDEVSFGAELSCKGKEYIF